MRIILLTMLCWLFTLPVWADQSNLILVIDGVTYSNVTFKAVTPTTVSIVHQTGVATIPLEKLPEELQKQFNYNPKKAAPYQLTLGPQSVGWLMPEAGKSARLSVVSEDVSNGPDSFGVPGSPFEAYDQKIIATIRKHWYVLIDQYGLKDGKGTVTVRCQIFNDGHLKIVKVLDGTFTRVLPLFCEKAIVESGPFDPLPKDLRARVGKAPRDASFTFYY